MFPCGCVSVLHTIWKSGCNQKMKSKVVFIVLISATTTIVILLNAFYEFWPRINTFISKILRKYIFCFLRCLDEILSCHILCFRNFEGFKAYACHEKWSGNTFKNKKIQEKIQNPTRNPRGYLRRTEGCLVDVKSVARSTRKCAVFKLLNQVFPPLHNKLQAHWISKI